MRSKIKPIGIRKNKDWVIPISMIIIFSLLASIIVLWWAYSDEYDYAYLVKNGVEVEATVTGYDYHSASHGVDGDSTDMSSGWYYIWECHYNGKRYSKTSGNNYFRTKEQVLQYLGEKFTVTVDPNSDWAVDRPISEIRPDGFKFKELLTAAIICTGITPVVLAVLTLLLIYPAVLNYKIDRAGKLPISGEVKKISGFIIYYVKVGYEDVSGQVREKWSKSWVTKKEAEFLRQKKIIGIVPYKNTYGILEEMQVECKKQRKPV